MTTTTIQTCTLRGAEAIPTTIEVELLRRLPATVIVGLPASAVRDVAELVRAAIVSARFDYPRLRVVVNVKPEGLQTGNESAMAPRSAVGLALPIAIAILVASGQVKPPPADWVLYGDLTLSGEVRVTRGVTAASRLGDGKLVTAWGSPVIRPALGLTHLAKLAGGAEWRIDMMASMPSLPADLRRPTEPTLPFGGRYDEAIDAAIRERKPLLLVGAPGAGCTLLARYFASRLPTLSHEAAEDVAAIHDAAGLLQSGAHLPVDPPFRAPHHTASTAGLVGNRTGRPGEAALARHGVLLLDEFVEFQRAALDALAVYRKRAGADFRLVAIARPGDDPKRLAHPLLDNAVRIEVS